MSSLNHDETFSIVKKQWDNFLELLKNEIKTLNEKEKDLRKRIAEIKKIEKMVIGNSYTPELLLKHCDLLISLDSSLKNEFKILDAFAKIPNLENPVAVEIYNKILTSVKNLDFKVVVDTLQKEILKNNKKIEQINGIIVNKKYDKNDLLALCKRLNISGSNLNSVLLFPILNAQKRAVKQREIMKKKSSVNLENKSDFESLKKIYDKILKKYNHLFNEYFIIINNFTEKEEEFYRSVRFKEEEELKVDEKIAKNYDDAYAKVLAMRIFDMKDNIDKLMVEIKNNEYQKQSDIKYLQMTIKDFSDLCVKLDSLCKDMKEKEREITSVKEPLIFFLTSTGNVNTLIDNEVLDKHNSDLMGFIKEAEEGIVQSRDNTSRVKLNMGEKNSKILGKTVFAYEKGETEISFVVLKRDNNSNNKDAILVITASPKEKGTLIENTIKIIKENKTKILRRIGLLEKRDPQEIGIQEIIMDEIKSKTLANKR